MFFRYFVADVRAFAVPSGLVCDAGARPLACGFLSVCVDVSVSGNRCRCSVRSFGYVHSGEADFEGSVCLPEDCVVTFQFSRTGLRHVVLMLRVQFLSSCPSVPSCGLVAAPVGALWPSCCGSLASWLLFSSCLLAVPGLRCLGSLPSLVGSGAPAAPCCLSIGSTPAARVALWRVRDCTGGSCQLSCRSWHLPPLPCGLSREFALTHSTPPIWESL